MADCIACSTATPNPLRAASSEHHGQRPPRLVLLKSTVGASNWGGSASANEIVLTLHTTLNWAAADCIACGALIPNLLRAALSQHHGGLPPCSVSLELTVGASITYHSTTPILTIFFLGWIHATTNWSDILMVCLHNYYRLLFALSFAILCLATLEFFLPIEIGGC
jgi:hypothetical protein